MLEEPSRVLLEVGPGQGLTSHALGERSRVTGRQNAVIPAMRWSYGLQSEQAVLLRAVGRLWLEGASIDTECFLNVEGGGRRRVSLPTYPFERKRHWIDPPTTGELPVTVAPARKKPDVADWFYVPHWKPSALPRRGPDDEDRGGAWLLFIDACGVGADLAGRLRARGDCVVTVERGAGFHCAGDSFTLDPRRGDDFDALVSELAAREQVPVRVVHLWCLTADDRRSPSASRFDEFQDLGYYSLVRLFQALFRRGLERPLRLDVVANHVCEVTGIEPLVPEKATLRARRWWDRRSTPSSHPGGSIPTSRRMTAAGASRSWRRSSRRSAASWRTPRSPTGAGGAGSRHTSRSAWGRSRASGRPSAGAESTC